MIINIITTIALVLVAIAFLMTYYGVRNVPDTKTATKVVLFVSILTQILAIVVIWAT